MSWGIMKWLFYMAAGYIMGSVLFGYFLPRYFKGIDVEKESADHNPGTANVIRFAGLPLGLLCLVLDVGKGCFPVFCAGRALPPASLWFAGVMAAPVLGHAFPSGAAGGAGRPSPFPSACFWGFYGSARACGFWRPSISLWCCSTGSGPMRGRAYIPSPSSARYRRGRCFLAGRRESALEIC